ARLPRPRPLAVAVLGVAPPALAAPPSARLGFRPPSARAQRASRLARWAAPILDIQVGVALVLGAYALVGLTGGQGSPAQPFLYLIIAFAVTFLARAGAIAACAAALGFELRLFAAGHDLAALAT